MASFKSRSLSLVRLSILAIVAVSLSAILVVVALGSVRNSSNQALGEWRRYADQASIEQRVFRGFITQAGLGGLTDDYARLVETGDETLVGKLYAHGGAALAAIAAYPVHDAATGEAVAALQGDVKAHLMRIGPIVAMHKAGKPAVEIARFAQVKDAAAANAMRTLAAAVAKTVPSSRGRKDPKALALLDFRRAVGIEGLVQYAGSFSRTGDPEQLARARQALTESRQALVRYRRHPIAVQEGVILAAIERQLDAIEIILNASPDAAKQRPNAAALQATLLKLETIVYNEATVAYNNLQSTLTQVSARAGLIIILVASGAAILVAGSVWLLAFRVARRVRAITATMRDLASGKLDVEIPSAKDGDEIGEMSRALLVFRDGLRANIALTKELADSSRLASLGAMVAGMAHELNTPLGNALAVSSTLEEQCKAFRKDVAAERILRSALEGHAATLQEAAVLIQRNLTRASEHIGSFKQVAVDQTSGQRREFALDDVLRNVVQTMTPQFKRTPYRLRLGKASGAMMDSYPGALSQVITNLIENGFRHGLAGQADGAVDVEVVCLGSDTTEIVVADNGVGIPINVLPRIFQAFFTTKAGSGGSGLGLHIVKSIVCGPLGGQIRAESDEGSGSRFIITLPNKAPGEARPESESLEGIFYAAARSAAA
jgi:signal transduction histidine kinase